MLYSMKCSLCGRPASNARTCVLNPNNKGKSGLHAPPKAPSRPRGKVSQYDKPRTMAERRKMNKECGETCVLVPPTKYPVCKRNTCQVSCDGVRAARDRAVLVLNRTTVSADSKRRAKTALVRARALGSKECGWK